MQSAKDFLKFVDQSPSPFHAVESAIRRLVASGFTEIREEDSWSSLKPSGKYFFTRNKSAIMAFTIGGKYQAGNGFSIVGAHTDSPCLKVKPKSKKTQFGYKQVGVEVYGGGIWHTWFDRELGLAGRVIISRNNAFEHHLVKIDKPILRIPTLAIHLDRGVKDGFKFNDEVQLTPILAQAAADDLNKTEEGKHHPEMLQMIAKEINCDISEIQDFELCLFDTQKAVIGGANDEFLHSARLDNLMMSFCSLEGIIGAIPTIGDDSLIRLIALFDNEEVGSQTAHGADSNLLEVTLKRLSALEIGSGPQDNFEEQWVLIAQDASFERAMCQSMLISADMAHAIHPNYSEKHESNHRPAMNQGVVVKQNANQRYATTSITTHILREVAKVASVQLQEFVVRNDSPCGSTIGPMLSARLGLRTIDVGNPQWSMHSIRETCGTKDIGDAITLFKTFFETFAKIDSQMPRL